MRKKREELIEAALRAKKMAYMPYSNFPVGAAILAASGNIYTGCNVENASYGLTICAERVAVCKAISEGEKSFLALAVAGDLNHPTPPCGACRQFLIEFQEDLEILLITDEEIVEKSLQELLPHNFKFSKERLER